MKLSRVGILHYASPPGIGGVEATIYHHARLLSALGLKVVVVSGKGEKFLPQIEFQLIPEVGSRFPQLQTINQSLDQGIIIQEFYNLQEYLSGVLLPIFSELDVCILHNAITLHKNLPLTAALHRLAETRVTSFVAWCHDFAWLDELYIPALHRGYPWDLLRSAWQGVKYVTVSDHRRRRFAKLSGLPTKDIQVINPGIDINELLKFEPLTQNLINKLDLLQTNPLILLPARITRRKNIEFAVRVTAALTGKFPQVRLLVTGPPGPHNPQNVAYLDSLLSLVEQLDIASNVNFLYQFGEGDQPLYLTAQVVADFFRLADLLLFPSHREGFGIPVLEAGLLRLPIFASEIAPIQESVGELAYLFDPKGDPVVVADAIASHLDIDRGYQLKQRVLNNYSWNSIVETKVMPLLKEVVKSE